MLAEQGRLSQSRASPLPSPLRPACLTAGSSVCMQRFFVQRDWHIAWVMCGAAAIR